MTSVVIEEIPDKLTLAVEISNCQGNCVGCHSAFLKTDIGEELTLDLALGLIDDNFGVNCFLLLGEGKDQAALLSFAAALKEARPDILLAIYSGREDVEDEIWEAFDYVKVGPYIASLGPLNSKTTNQRLYRVPLGRSSREDLTPRFWHRGIDSNR